MPRTISLHDTRTGMLTDLAPEDGVKVGIYACGPTVYDRIHVGNARPFVVFSLLRRFLAHEGYEPTFVANVTDVNDKIYAAAAARGIPSAELAQEMTAAYIADTELLGLGRPDHEPLATETMEGIVALIAELIEGGHAYAADGDVYFAVRSFPGYGGLSHRPVGEMEQGEDDDGRKRDPLDFALWKGEKAGEDTAWEAPWGRGRPGWHIECSAMAEAILGAPFEIHGGGSDLVFPHHENEAAQTEAARGRPLARIWMHNGMLRLDQRRMGKSEGNAFALHTAVEAFGRDALVLYFSEGHYRQPIQYSEERLEAAAAHARRIREAARALPAGPPPPELAPLKERFLAALARDFNTPEALAVIDEWVRAANAASAKPGRDDLVEMLDVLGLASLAATGGEGPPPAALTLLAQRETARAERDWPAADALRDELRALGWEVRDSPAGAELVAVT